LLGIIPISIPNWIAVIVAAFFGGVAIGYAIKIAFKIMLALLGFYLIVTGIFWYYGLIMFNPDAAITLGSKIYSVVKGNIGTLYEVSTNIIAPIASFIMGILFSFRKIK